MSKKTELFYMCLTIEQITALLNKAIKENNVVTLDFEKVDNKRVENSEQIRLITKLF